MSGKVSGAYHLFMPDATQNEIQNSRAVPLTFTVQRDNSHWVVRAWYHGYTIHDALHPVLVAENTISHDQAPPHALWGELYRAVAIAIEDLAAGNNIRAYRE